MYSNDCSVVNPAPHIPNVSLPASRSAAVKPARCAAPIACSNTIASPATVAFWRTSIVGLVLFELAATASIGAAKYWYEPVPGTIAIRSPVRIESAQTVSIGWGGGVPDSIELVAHPASTAAI